MGIMIDQLFFIIELHLLHKSLSISDILSYSVQLKCPILVLLLISYCSISFCSILVNFFLVCYAGFSSSVLPRQCQILLFNQFEDSFGSWPKALSSFTSKIENFNPVPRCLTPEAFRNISFLETAMNCQPETSTMPSIP